MINNEINFLDLNVIHYNKIILFNIYAKRNDFAFQVSLFTHYNSYLHESVYANILLNFAHRINNICSNNFNNLQNLKLVQDLAIK